MHSRVSWRLRASALMASVMCAGALPPPAHSQLLALDEALRAGEAQSPRLAAQRHALGAAEEQTGRATQLPDPRLRLGIENLPVTGADRFRYDRDFMTMRAIGFMQEFPNASKREARGARAERMRDVERAMLESQRVMLRRDIAGAWLEVHFAERAVGAQHRLVGQLRDQADASAAALARGRQALAESLMARAAEEEARDRGLDLERLVRRARLGLATFLGLEAQRPLGPVPDLGRLRYSEEELVFRLQNHPQLRVIEGRQRVASAEVRLAETMKKPDWSVEVGYGYRKPAFDNMLTVMVAIDLPWQTERRQDRDVASRLAELEQADALREDARRVLEAELRGWLADYRSAGERTERYRTVLLPLARDRAEAALSAYRGGRGELSSLIDARRALAQTELALIAIEAERARAWAALTYAYPDGSHQ